jgi:hypothetical protein
MSLSPTEGSLTTAEMAKNRDASISRNAINSRDAKNNSSDAGNDETPIAKAVSVILKLL